MSACRRFVFLASFLCAGISAPPADITVQKGADLEDRRLFIRSGTLFTKEGVPISLSGFDADIQSEKPQPGATTVTPKQIKNVMVRSGSAFVRAEDLSKLLKARISNDKLTELVVSTDNSEMKISGKLKKAIPVSFEIKGPVSLTPEGLIQLRERTVKVDKLPKGLVEMFGMDPSQAVGNNSAKGLTMTKDALLFDPNLLWGMSVHGRLSSVKVIRNGLLLVYAEPRKTVQPASK